MNKTRTITLTGRPPVRVSDDKWPLIASASDKEYEGQVECQSFRTSKWFIGVRQHADGRAIVYARYTYTTAWGGERDYSAACGTLLSAEDAAESGICDEIQQVCDEIARRECYGEDCDRWPSLAETCIADLPAVEL